MYSTDLRFKNEYISKYTCSLTVTVSLPYWSLRLKFHFCFLLFFFIFLFINWAGGKATEDLDLLPKDYIIRKVDQARYLTLHWSNTPPTSLKLFKILQKDWSSIADILFFSLQHWFVTNSKTFASWFLVFFWKKPENTHTLVNISHCWSS